MVGEYIQIPIKMETKSPNSISFKRRMIFFKKNETPFIP